MAINSHVSDEERRGFDFFRRQTLPELSLALFPVLEDSLFLQFSHASAAVRHAAIALASIDERVQIHPLLNLENEQANRRHYFAQLQYHKAIRHVRESLKDPVDGAEQLTLVACILFICIEALQGNDEEALVHIRSGLQILCKRRTNGFEGGKTNAVASTRAHDRSFEDLAFILARLDIQYAVWFSKQTFESDWAIPIEGSNFDLVQCESYSSVMEAAYHLHIIMNGMYCLLHSAAAYSHCTSPAQIPPNVFAERQECIKQLSMWPNAIDEFLARCGKELSPGDIRRATTLRVNQMASLIFILASFEDQQAVYHSLEPVFEQILSLAEPLLESRPMLKPPTRISIFSFPTTLISPLFLTATKSTVLRTRQKALSMLRTKPWRESAWDSITMARIAERDMHV
ncbi:hypothetical protein MMC20_007189 [Loxospora ochrophaea]|nr:hypothetical protein [Loxospora ochrophaea]